MASTESLSTTESRFTGSSRRQQIVARTVAVLGLALVGAGVAAVFTTDSDTGAAALLAVGVLLVLLVVFEDRLESLRYGDLELVLRRKADEAVSAETSKRPRF